MDASNNGIPYSCYLGAASETADLRVEISRVLELVDDHAADVVQQRVLVHRVLHLRHFAQVLEVESPSLPLIQKVTDSQKSRHDVPDRRGKQTNRNLPLFSF